MPHIFISYRRVDSMAASGRIYDHLTEVFGEANIFKDVENIEAGDDFRVVLTNAVNSCDVLLVIIGPEWLNASDTMGRRRLDDPHDYVRLEIETGLKRSDALVIPLLIENASMPRPSDLPPSMQDLCFRNAMPIRNDPDFHRDIHLLIDHIQRHFKKVAKEHRRVSPLLIAAVLMLILIGAGAFFVLNQQNATIVAATTEAPTEVVLVEETEVIETETPTIEPTATSIPATPEPTVLYPDGKLIQLLYNANSFYAYNPEAANVPADSLSFVALDTNGDETNYRFEGREWLVGFRFIEANACARIEIVMAQPLLRPGECQKYNSTLTPTASDNQIFWIPRPDITHFAVFWNRNEIARCETSAEQCDIFLPM